MDENNSVYDSRNNCNAIIETATNSLVQGCKATVIPDGITTIAYGALAEFSSIKNVVLPSTITTIADYAFAYCEALESIVIPASVKNVGTYVFAGCNKLKNIVVETGNSAYDSRDNCNAIIETATNTLIQGCNTTVIPQGITGIGISAFCNFIELTNITIPNSVTTIGENAFGGCMALTNITLPENVTTIGNNAFSNCVALTSFDVPNSVTSIGHNAFSRCSALTNVTIGENVKTIDYMAFYYCSNLKGLSIPANVTSIGAGAFEGCKSLEWLCIEDATEALTLGKNISNGQYYSAFFESVCPLQTLYLGRNIELGNNCRELFDYSSKLTTLEIGKNVTDLSNVSFQNCNNIKNVYSLNPVPPTIREYYTFNSFNRATLYVPYGALDTYKSNREWRYFFKDILEFDATGIENVETDVSAFEITAEGIVFTAAEDKPVTIYTASGALVEKINSYTGEEIILEKGVYIINVADKSIKVKL